MANSFTAKLRNYRVSPRKARLVVDLIRGKHVQTALDILKVTNKKTALALSKLVQSALDNVTKSATVDVDRLVIKAVFVDEGPTMRRFIPRARGRASPIRKRTSHITLNLEEL